MSDNIFSYSSGECSVSYGSDTYQISVPVVSASLSQTKLYGVIRKNNAPYTFQSYDFTDSPIVVNVSKDGVSLTGEITRYIHNTTTYYLFNGEFLGGNEEVLKLSGYLCGFTDSE